MKMRTWSFFVTSIAALCVLTGCGTSANQPLNSSISGGAGLEPTIEISAIGSGFILAPEGSDVAVDYHQFGSLSSLSVANNYFLVYQFSFAPTVDNDGTAVLNAEISFPDLSVFNAFVIESSSGSDQMAIPYKDPTTGAQMKKITASFRVPETQAQEKEELIVFKIKPTASGQTSMGLNFESENAYVAPGGGSDGAYKTVVVDPYTITAPKLSSSGNRLQWNHVKFADYYKIFVEGTALKSNGGDYHFLVDEATAVGATLTFQNYSAFNISGNDLSFKIQACSTNANFYPSSYSNEIFLTI